MVWWSKWFGGGHKDGPPRLDPPDVTAGRVEKKRLADMAVWTAYKAKNTLPQKITRGGVEKVLKSQGFVKKRGDPESYFEKRLSDRKIMLWINLKTFGDGEIYPPQQRLIVSASLTTYAYADVEAEITGTRSATISMAYIKQREFADYVLTEGQVTDALAQVEADILAVNSDEVLAEFRSADSARPGSAGVQHLAALALAGDIDTLDGYVRRRMGNDPCGFVSYITDDMISRAAKIGHRHG